MRGREASAAGAAARMSTQCRQFVQNAWKKELCSNCFKSREEHATNQEALRPLVARTANSVKRVAHKVQGILRARETNGKQQVRSKRKNVAFPESLAEIIGYDGGDDFPTDEEENGTEAEGPDDEGDSTGGAGPPDSEEERALGNLTRANTNFNTVTANLTGPAREAPAPEVVAQGLKLGRAQKDAEGRKTTLLVSVKPFGGDDSLPTARRPSDKKSPEPAKPKPEKKPETKSGPESSAKALTAAVTAAAATPAGKIVDMPLITSTNLLAMMEPKRTASVARSPAIKKPESEKPRLAAAPQPQQPSPDKELAARNQKNLGLSNGVELTLAPIGAPSDIAAAAAPLPKKAQSSGCKAEEQQRSPVGDLAERKVEGEAAREAAASASRAYPCEGSRESAGEPDGKADEEVVAEPPALPKVPPPLESAAQAGPRASFLHGASEAKAAAAATLAATTARPQVPLKPQLPAKAVGASLASLLSENRAYEFRLARSLAHSQSETQLSEATRDNKPKPETYLATFRAIDKDDQTEEEEEEDEDDSEASGDQARALGAKRRMAPQPPTEEPASSLFARNPAQAANSDCPVVREKEKRERASSCSPKFRKAAGDELPEATSLAAGAAAVAVARPPEPAPRRNISLSQDSLAAGACAVEEKKKARSKFSLKKFLRMGTRKDVDMTCGSSCRSDEIPSTPQPKPRLEIIHPLELDGADVQVLRNDKSEDTTDSKTESVQSNSCQPVHGAHHVTVRPSKPPPPPRAQSLDESSRSRASPATAAKQQQQQQSGKWQPSTGSSASDSIYANLGAMRSGLAPAKPRRTSSMRDQAGGSPGPGPGPGQPAHLQHHHHHQQHPRGHHLQRTTQEPLDAPVPGVEEPELRQGVNHPVSKRQSDSCALESSGQAEFKFQAALFARSTSLPYCASEAESDLYSPFGFYNGDEVSEDGHEWRDEKSRIGRLRQRRGRSIVHRSLEDNYGAVIVANHEALAQLLEQANQAAPLPAGLRGLKTADLHLGDFSVERGSAVAAGRRLFLSATWAEQPVTLCLLFEPSTRVTLREFYLAPVVEFADEVPRELLDLVPGRKGCGATVSVLPRLRVNTLQSFAGAIALEAREAREEQAARESSFVLLQLVSALKSLQARGIEEAPAGLGNVALCREDKDAYHRLYLFQGLGAESSESNEDECVSLCQCALNALEELQLANRLPLIQELLMREKAVTLSQVKSVLEFSLWGPADATLGGPRERETALQRWLDLERATVLQALVRARAHLTVTDEYQLLFLVHTSAKVMCEASLLLDRQRNGLVARPS